MKKRLIKVILLSLLLVVILVGYYFINRHFHIGIPCIVHSTTGYYCPGCGVTRMLFSLLSLKIKDAFMYKIVSDVVDVMKDAYPYLVEKRPYVEALVLEEEKLFLKTLEEGERRLKEMTENSTDGVISGEDAFKLCGYKSR